MDNDILELRKALDTSTTNGNNVLDPILLSKVISEQANRKAQIRNVIPRIPFPGKVYTWDTEVTPGDAVTATDGATLSLIDGSYVQNQAAMSFFYMAGYITNPAIESMAELIDAVALRVGGATKALLRKENSAIFNGDPLNAQYPGLLSTLQASSTFGYAGSGNTLSSGLMTSIETNLLMEGYDVDVWVVTKGAYQILKEAAFNKVTFFGLSGGGNFGFPVASGETLMFNGKPVIPDVYAGPITAVASETAVVVTGTSNLKWTTVNSPVNPQGAANLTDQAGTALPAPVVKVGGVTVNNYTISGNVITFTSAPSAAPTVAYSYAAETIYALSLNPANLCIPELMSVTVDKDNIQAPVTLDALPFRVKEYCTLAVRNPKAHCVATNIVLPATSSAFSS